jgi:hypothetical protein
MFAAFTGRGVVQSDRRLTDDDFAVLGVVPRLPGDEISRLWLV